ncbi:MAG TPA: universal stress protein, partial [Gemmatimonadales bacterium]
MGELTVPPVEMDEEFRREEEAYLVRTAESLGRVGEGPARIEIVDGITGEAICDEAGRVGADLIVMATHGRNALGRLWLGSVADYVVRHADRPVLLIRPDRTAADKPARPLRNILVPLDPSKYSESILDSVRTLARLIRGELTLVTVVAPRFGSGASVPQSPPGGPEVSARRSDEAHARLDRIAWQLRGSDIPVATRVVAASTAASGILRVLEEAKFDMVALATHGAAGIRRMLIGSVAEKVIRSTRKPVLVYHPATP